MSLTGAHHNWPVLGCTALPVGPAAERVLRMPAASHVDAPGRSAFSTEEAAAAARRNAAAPPGGPQAETLDDPAHRERERERHSVFSIVVKS